MGGNYKYMIQLLNEFSADSDPLKFLASFGNFGDNERPIHLGVRIEINKGFKYVAYCLKPFGNGQHQKVLQVDGTSVEFISFIQDTNEQIILLNINFKHTSQNETGKMVQSHTSEYNMKLEFDHKNPNASMPNAGPMQ